ncbi:hypothetical protein [Natrinema sp. HArc-T2]|uniref:hypothetical protein n=1 Tax=Natrinema sp. HArc-T2 TaxID=3242701 RepID=UPI00359CEE7B
MVDSVRYGFLGYSDLVQVAPASYEGIVPLVSLAALTVLTAVVVGIDVYLFKTGCRLTD